MCLRWTNPTGDRLNEYRSLEVHGATVIRIHRYFDNQNKLRFAVQAPQGIPDFFLDEVEDDWDEVAKAACYAIRVKLDELKEQVTEAFVMLL